MIYVVTSSYRAQGSFLQDFWQVPCRFEYPSMSEQTHHARHAQESSMVSGIPSLGTANSPDSHSRASCFHDIPLLSLHELAADDRTCNICYAAYVSERVADDNSEGEHPLQLP